MADIYASVVGVAVVDNWSHIYANCNWNLANKNSHHHRRKKNQTATTVKQSIAAHSALPTVQCYVLCFVVLCCLLSLFEPLDGHRYSMGANSLHKFTFPLQSVSHSINYPTKIQQQPTIQPVSHHTTFICVCVYSESVTVSYSHSIYRRSVEYFFI